MHCIQIRKPRGNRDQERSLPRVLISVLTSLILLPHFLYPPFFSFFFFHDPPPLQPTGSLFLKRHHLTYFHRLNIYHWYITPWVLDISTHI